MSSEFDLITMRKVGKTTAGIAAVVTICLLSLYWWMFAAEPIDIDTTVWGAFGDWFSGVIGTVLSAATVALLVVSVLVQLENYETTRTELKETKTALADQLTQSRERAALDSFQAALELLLKRVDAFNSLRSVGSQLSQTILRGDIHGWESGLGHAKQTFRDAEGNVGPLLKLVNRLATIAIEEAPVRSKSLLETLSAFLNDDDIRSLKILAHFGVPNRKLDRLFIDDVFLMSEQKETEFNSIREKFSRPANF